MSFRDQDKGAQPGESPVREAIRAAESRLRDGAPLASAIYEIMAFESAEAKWLGAFAAWRALISSAAGDDRTAEAEHSKAEREASAAFALTPLPALIHLPRKLWLIEKEAFEVAHNGLCGKDLAVWLTALRLDLMRLLAQPEPRKAASGT